MPLLKAANPHVQRLALAYGCFGQMEVSRCYAPHDVRCSEKSTAEVEIWPLRDARVYEAMEAERSQRARMSRMGDVASQRSRKVGVHICTNLQVSSRIQSIRTYMYACVVVVLW